MIDSHAHLTSETLCKESLQLVQRAQAAGVSAIVNICTNEESLREGLLLAKECPSVFNAAAATPHDVATIGESFFPIVAKRAREGKLVAIGETGLDYHYEHSPRELQKEHLLRYVALAKECSLPLIFHCREAFADLFSFVGDGPALLHCFTGSTAEAKGVIERGWLLSLSGIVTYKKSEELRAVAKNVPLSQLVIETDSPYLAPQSKRGQKNEPAYIGETASVIAAARGIAVEEVIEATRENAIRFFSLPKEGRGV